MLQDKMSEIILKKVEYSYKVEQFWKTHLFPFFLRVGKNMTEHPVYHCLLKNNQAAQLPVPNNQTPLIPEILPMVHDSQKTTKALLGQQ